MLLSNLDLTPLRFDQEIYNRCGRLVIHLKDVYTGEEVSLHRHIGVNGSDCDVA